jgi:lysophospholipase L1-like esterase
MTTETAPLSLRRRIAFFAVPFVAFFGALAAVEALARATLPHVSSLDLFVTNPQQQAQSVDRAHFRIYEGDPLLFWRPMPNLRGVVWDATPVTTNAQGLRYDHDIGPKPKGTFRIVCAGDSVTFGFRVPRVYLRRPREKADWLPYPALLEKWLRAANPGRTVEVIPLATPGYSSHQGLAWLRRDIGWLQPDVVTACFGWNDMDLADRSDAAAMKGDWLSVTGRRLLSRSQALIHVSRWLASRHAPKAPPPETVRRVERDAYVANLLEMARLARRHGAAAVLIGPVYRDRVSHPPEGDIIAGYRDALRAAARAQGIPYFEVPELTEAAYPANARLFEEHIHPNHRGQRVLAAALLPFLRDNGLLDGLAAPDAPAPHGAAEAAVAEPVETYP